MSARAMRRGAGRSRREPPGEHARPAPPAETGRPAGDEGSPAPPARPRGRIPGPPEPDSLDVRRWPTGRLLSAAARRVEQRWNEALATWDLTHAGLGVLAALVAGPLTQRDIAQRVLVEDQTMSRTLDRLERAGHVTRHSDAVDRRRRIVTLTPSGRDAVESVLSSRVAETLVDDVVPDHEAFRDALVSVLEHAAGRSVPAGGTPSVAAGETPSVPAARLGPGGEA